MPPDVVVTAASVVTFVVSGVPDAPTPVAAFRLKLAAVTSPAPSLTLPADVTNTEEPSAVTVLSVRSPLVTVVSVMFVAATTSVAARPAPVTCARMFPLTASRSCKVSASADNNSSSPAVAFTVAVTPPVPLKFRNTPVPPDVAVTVVTFRSRLGFAPFAPIPVDAVSVRSAAVTSVVVPLSASVMVPVRAFRLTLFAPRSRPVTMTDPPTTSRSNVSAFRSSALTLTAPVPSAARPIVTVPVEFRLCSSAWLNTSSPAAPPSPMFRLAFDGRNERPPVPLTVFPASVRSAAVIETVLSATFTIEPASS